MVAAQAVMGTLHFLVIASSVQVELVSCELRLSCPVVGTAQRKRVIR